MATGTRGNVAAEGEQASSERTLRKDLSGLRFVRLMVRFPVRKNGKVYWSCLCDCGVETLVYGSKLTSGCTKSCGCYSKDAAKSMMTTHGKSRTRAHIIWCKMLTRCTDKNCKDYERYSKLGVSDEWKTFENFFRDMGECPPGLSIDRIDNNKGYFHGNCRWATSKQQARNKASNVLVEYLGRTQTVAGWCEELGLNYDRTRQRLRKLGMPPERAFNASSFPKPQKEHV